MNQTTPDQLRALADRCEAATEADQQTLLSIAFGLTDPTPLSGYNDREWSKRWQAFAILLDAGAYLDAAMILVPEGWLVEKQGEYPWPDRKGRPFYALLRPRGYGDTKRAHSIDASTPALALCAASLRARAASMGEG